MKLIALGDIHGRTAWKDVVAKNDYHKLVIIGDYFDAHEKISPEDQIENFKEIVAFKRLHTDKVALLFGNHDFHYLKSNDEQYSGYQVLHAAEITDLVHDALEHGWLQMCYVHDNFIFTHAGVTKTWSRNVFGEDFSVEQATIEKMINDLFYTNPNAFHFTRGINRSPTGDDVTQSPIWVRPKSLLEDSIDGFTQVVGHTQQQKINIIDNIAFIDTLGHSGEYLVIEDGEMKIAK